MSDDVIYYSYRFTNIGNITIESDFASINDDLLLTINNTLQKKEKLSLTDCNTTMIVAIPMPLIWYKNIIVKNKLDEKTAYIQTLDIISNHLPILQEDLLIDFNYEYLGVNDDLDISRLVIIASQKKLITAFLQKLPNIQISVIDIIPAALFRMFLFYFKLQIIDTKSILFLYKEGDFLLFTYMQSYTLLWHNFTTHNDILVEYNAFLQRYKIKNIHDLFIIADTTFEYAKLDLSAKFHTMEQHSSWIAQGLTLWTERAL